MDGFLVVARGPMDDVPLHFVASLREAKALADAVTLEGVEAATRSSGWGCEPSNILNVAVVQFEAGQMARHVWIREVYKPSKRERRLQAAIALVS